VRLASILLASLVVTAALAPMAKAQTAAAAAAPGQGDWRPVDVANTLVIDTNKGRIIVELYPEIAPNTVTRIETLARRGFYDGLSFFRVIDGFMDQTGDPKNTGEGGSDLPNVSAELNFRLTPGPAYPVLAHAPAGGDAVFYKTMPVLTQPAAMAALTADGKVMASALFCPGVMGMARASDLDSANSQFFLMRGEHLDLDGRYATLGRVVVGQDVVDAIKIGEPAPDPQDRMTKVQMLGDMPAGQRPTVEVMDTGSPYLKALAAQAKAARGDAFDPCDLPVQGRVD